MVNPLTKRAAKAVPLASSKILPFEQLSHVFSTTLTAFWGKFSPKRHYPITAALVAHIPHHHYHFLQAWKFKHFTDPLWWSCVCKMDGIKKRVVRSHLARRMRLAWIESLRKQGYARDGSRLPGSPQGADLEGTLQLTPLPEMLNMPNEELQKQSDELLQRILDKSNAAREKGRRSQENGPKGQHKTEPKAKAANKYARRP